MWSWHKSLCFTLLFRKLWKQLSWNVAVLVTNSCLCCMVDGPHLQHYSEWVGGGPRQSRSRSWCWCDQIKWEWGWGGGECLLTCGISRTRAPQPWSPCECRSGGWCRASAGRTRRAGSGGPRQQQQHNNNNNNNNNTRGSNISTPHSDMKVSKQS